MNRQLVKRRVRTEHAQTLDSLELGRAAWPLACQTSAKLPPRWATDIHFAAPPKSRPILRRLDSRTSYSTDCRRRQRTELNVAAAHEGSRLLDDDVWLSEDGEGRAGSLG